MPVINEAITNSLDSFIHLVSQKYDLSIDELNIMWVEGCILVFDRYSLVDFYVETWPEYKLSKIFKLIKDDLKDGFHLQQITNNLYTWIG
tara:strand:+ start:918 stop:1187 length:270 start_codon:yes stop_codon:yes gene_type:complete